MARVQRIFVVLVGSIAFGVVSLYAGRLLAHNRQISEDIQALQQVGPPEALDSEIGDLSWYTAPDAATASSPAPTLPRLVFVTTRECDTCGEARRAWLQALEAQDARGKIELWLVGETASEDSAWARHEFELRGISTRALELRNAEEFAFGTGIRAVPMAVLLHGQRIACAVSGIPTRSATEECTRRLTAGSAPGSMFVENNSSVVLLFPQPGCPTGRFPAASGSRP